MFSKNKKLIGYSVFFLALFIAFYLYISQYMQASPLQVINNDVKDFSFTNQNGGITDSRTVEGKVYVAEYFFTTCRDVCPRMNAYMRQVYETYKDEKDFVIISHTCMPETDSVPKLKDYENWMVNGTLKEKFDGSFMIIPPDSDARVTNNKNWFFVTGKKDELYKMARLSYLIDDNTTGRKSNAGTDEFLHTQFFALVDRQRRLRKIYDGLKPEEVKELIKDIDILLKEGRPNRNL